MSCKSTKCKYYEGMKKLRKIDGGADGPCLYCKRFYPDNFTKKKED